jgi:hypothetical protein
LHLSVAARRKPAPSFLKTKNRTNTQPLPVHPELRSCRRWRADEATPECARPRAQLHGYLQAMEYFPTVHPSHIAATGTAALRQRGNSTAKFGFSGIEVYARAPHEPLVAQVSKPAVSPTSKSAAHRMLHQQRVWKPATQQTWKSALRASIGSGVQCANFLFGEFSPRPSPPGEGEPLSRRWIISRSLLPSPIPCQLQISTRQHVMLHCSKRSERFPPLLGGEGRGEGGRHH